MHLFLTIIAFLMVTDALFTWANYDKVESLLKKQFPKLDLKVFAFIEGLIGLLILSIKVFTKTIT
ncbi:MAG: hypothetical protein ACI86H_000773 [bacterium]|jgi:hypothetical protein